MLSPSTFNATIGKSAEKGLIFLDRLMSDYEVTLVNDNSMTSRKDPCIAHIASDLTRDSVRHQNPHRVAKAGRSWRLTRPPEKARVLRSLQGA